MARLQYENKSTGKYGDLARNAPNTLIQTSSAKRRRRANVTTAGLLPTLAAPWSSCQACNAGSGDDHGQRREVFRRD